MAVEVILTIDVARVLDLRVGDGVDADVALAVPAECFHDQSFLSGGFSLPGAETPPSVPRPSGRAAARGR